MIQQVRVPIADTDNVEVVHDKLMILGGKLVLETVDAILNDTVKPIAQEDMAVVGELRPAPKIFKETCRIDWNSPVKRCMISFVVCRLILLHGVSWSVRKEKRW